MLSGDPPAVSITIMQHPALDVRLYDSSVTMLPLVIRSSTGRCVLEPVERGTGHQRRRDGARGRSGALPRPQRRVYGGHTRGDWGGEERTRRRRRRRYPSAVASREARGLLSPRPRALA